MRGKEFPIGIRAALAIFTILLVTSAWAATEKKLHDFTYGSGYDPASSLIFDAAGNLYGTTAAGGSYGGGTVFELSPREDGGWTEKTLHNFGHGMDGAYSQASLIFDAAGNLYGTTAEGGDYNCPASSHGCGTVFELSPKEGGGWTEKVLHNFGHGMDGAHPWAPLTIDSEGNLYGTTNSGGVYRVGTVFEMTPGPGGVWTEKTLHHFGLYPTDGRSSTAGLVFDAAGNLYGTSQKGGSYGLGTVFEVMPNGGGGWREKVLHNFGRIESDGIYPMAGLIFDAAGNLYGTTSNGGGWPGWGTVFEMTPKDCGGWTENKLHHFTHSVIYGSEVDGGLPQGALIFDAAGNLYGTTAEGGDHWFPDGIGLGTVFEITP